MDRFFRRRLEPTTADEEDEDGIILQLFGCGSALHVTFIKVSPLF